MKICGVSEPVALDTAVASGARWVGFVLFARSPRAVTEAVAGALARRLPATVAPVALFVEPDDASIAALLDAIPDAVLQIYDTEARVAAIRARFGRETWRAVPLGPGETPPSTTGADRLVIEAASGADDTTPGGNGRALDWSSLRGWQPPVPWLLAGGLTPDNVADAIARSGATAVDVSSGVERARGSKDPALIRRFVAAAGKARGVAP